MKRIGDYAKGGKLLGKTVYDFDTDRQATLAEWNGNFYTVVDEYIEIEKIELIKEGDYFTLYVNGESLATGYNGDPKELVGEYSYKGDLIAIIRKKHCCGDRFDPRDLKNWYMEEE